MSKKKGFQPTSSAFKTGAAAASKQRSDAAGRPQKAPTRKPNPFETKVNKSKFNVLNRNVAGTTGRPTHAKARSLQKRTRTILPELQRRGRTGGFVDRRFGERDSSLSTDEKMLERFSRERLRTKRRKAVFNLNDAQEGQATEEQGAQEDYSHTLTLTHRGRSIDDLDAFDSDPDEDLHDDNDLDADTVSGGHFGGERSRAEIMQEVIAKSKRHKLERQRQREEDAALCDTLDADFDSLLTQGSLPATRPPRELRQNARAGRDDYDEVLRAMAFDRRSQPSDRTKRPEEVEEEAAKKANEFLVAQRKRMLGKPDAEDGASDESEASGTEAQKSERANVSEEEEELDDAEKSIRKVMGQVKGLLATIRSALDLATVNESFAHLAVLARTNSVIPVARVVREELGELTQSIGKLAERGRAPTMPDRETLMLFHVIGRIFSTSDFHHIVATPAMLLMAAFLEQGRLLRREHLLGALFLIQTCLTYTAESKRFFPEALSLLHACASLALAQPPNTDNTAWTPYPATRFMSKPIYEFLTTPYTMDESVQVRPMSFRDLIAAKDVSKSATVGFLLYLIRATALQYKESAAAPELLGPFLELLKQTSSSSLVADVEGIIESALSCRRPLQMLKKKATPIPSLVPDLDDGRAQTREEREHRHLQRAYKRELKGAKRELKRDSAFLAQQKLQMRLEADRKYNERIRQLVGSIANESADGAKRKRHHA